MRVNTGSSRPPTHSPARRPPRRLCHIECMSSHRRRPRLPGVPRSFSDADFLQGLLRPEQLLVLGERRVVLRGELVRHRRQHAGARADRGKKGRGRGAHAPRRRAGPGRPRRAAPPSRRSSSRTPRASAAVERGGEGVEGEGKGRGQRCGSHGVVQAQAHARGGNARGPRGRDGKAAAGQKARRAERWRRRSARRGAEGGRETKADVGAKAEAERGGGSRKGGERGGVARTVFLMSHSSAFSATCLSSLRLRSSSSFWYSLCSLYSLRSAARR